MAQEELHGTTNKLSDYHKGKSLELQKAGTTQEITKAPPEGAAPSPTHDPYADSSTTTDMDPAARTGKKGARPTTSPATSVGSRATLGRHTNQEPG